jgi:hypothetical protein
MTVEKKVGIYTCILYFYCSPSLQKEFNNCRRIFVEFEFELDCNIVVLGDYVLYLMSVIYLSTQGCLDHRQGDFCEMW